MLAGLSLYLSSGTGLALERDLALEKWQVGLVFSAFSVGYGLIGPLAGELAARRGAAPVLGAAMAAMAGLALLFAQAGQLEQLVGLRALIGACAGTVTPVGTLLLARTVAPKRLPLAIGLAFAGFGVGSVLPFGVLVPLLGADDWRGHARAAAVLAAAAATLVLLIGRAVERGRAADEAPLARLSVGHVRSVLGRREVLILALYTAPILIPTIGVVPWAPIYLQSGLGTTAGLAGTLTSAVGLGQIIAPLVSGWLMLRIGAGRVLLFAPLMYVLIPAAMALARSELAVLGLVFLSGFFPKFGFSAVLAITPRVVGVQQTGLAVGYINLVSFVLALAPPVLFGWVLDLSGSFPLAFLSLAAVATPGVVLGWLVHRLLARRSAAAERG